jgi:pyruvyl transferase EpsO
MGLENLHLAPDMAHALYPVDPVPGTPDGVLYLLRRDSEATGTVQPAADAGTVRDWQDIIGPADTLQLAAIAAASRLCRRTGSPAALDAALDALRADLVGRGIRLVSAHERVVSSRLHGALLGLLLGKQVRFLENLTGKSKAYYDTWLADFPDCTYGAELR